MRTKMEVAKAFLFALSKPIRWLASFFNPQDLTTSMKRGNMAISTCVLSWGFGKVISAIAYAIKGGWHATMPDVLMVGVISLPLAALAGAVYIFKPDGTMAVGGQPPAEDPKPKEEEPQ